LNTVTAKDFSLHALNMKTRAIQCCVQNKREGKRERFFFTVILVFQIKIAEFKNSPIIYIEEIRIRHLKEI